MRFALERQQLRALLLEPIVELPAYADDARVTCRVGKTVAKHTNRALWDGAMQIALERSLR